MATLLGMEQTMHETTKLLLWTLRVRNGSLSLNEARYQAYLGDKRASDETWKLPKDRKLGQNNSWMNNGLHWARARRKTEFHYAGWGLCLSRPKNSREWELLKSTQEEFSTISINVASLSKKTQIGKIAEEMKEDDVVSLRGDSKKEKETFRKSPRGNGYGQES